MTCQMDIISCREWMLGSLMLGFPLVIKQIIMLIPWLFLVSNKQTTWKFLHFHSCFEKLTLVSEICSGLWFWYWQCYGCIWNQLNTMRVEFLVKKCYIFLLFRLYLVNLATWYVAFPYEGFCGFFKHIYVFFFFFFLNCNMCKVETFKF